jgi:uncharacterized protein YjbI with pentapeptide repeats
MAEFKNEDLSGSTFEELSLADARFHDVTLRNARFDWVDMRGVQINGAWLKDVTIDADLDNVVINGVDVLPLIEAELDRRYPGREKMRPEDPQGYREAWDLLEDLWAQTVERARGFTPEQLHESVNGEWSFIETQRHLVFATDAWIRRALLGDPVPWSPLDLPHDEMDDQPSVPRDREVRPSLDEVLALRKDRQATMREVLDKLTDDQLASMTEPVLEPGYPESESFAVTRCLRAILNEEFEHRRFAERDLDLLAATT